MSLIYVDGCLLTQDQFDQLVTDEQCQDELMGIYLGE